jgi:hypothetical protein
VNHCRKFSSIQRHISLQTPHRTTTSKVRIPTIDFQAFKRTQKTPTQSLKMQTSQKLATQKTLALTEKGKPMALTTLPIPSPKENQLLIKTTVCGSKFLPLSHHPNNP